MTGQIQETESPQSNVNNLQIDLEQSLNSNIKNAEDLFKHPFMTTTLLSSWEQYLSGSNPYRLCQQAQLRLPWTNTHI